jgi:hypothetical protein
VGEFDVAAGGTSKMTPSDYRRITTELEKTLSSFISGNLLYSTKDLICLFDHFLDDLELDGHDDRTGSMRKVPLPQHVKNDYRRTARMNAYNNDTLLSYFYSIILAHENGCAKHTGLKYRETNKIYKDSEPRRYKV